MPSWLVHHNLAFIAAAGRIGFIFGLEGRADWFHLPFTLPPGLRFLLATQPRPQHPLFYNVEFTQMRLRQRTPNRSCIKQFQPESPKHMFGRNMSVRLLTTSDDISRMLKTLAILLRKLNSSYILQKKTKQES